MFLNIMEPGDTFGEIALLDGRHRANVVSATKASAAASTQFAQYLAGACRTSNVSRAPHNLVVEAEQPIEQQAICLSTALLLFGVK